VAEVLQLDLEIVAGCHFERNCSHRLLDLVLAMDCCELGIVPDERQEETQPLVVYRWMQPVDSCSLPESPPAGFGPVPSCCHRLVAQLRPYCGPRLDQTELIARAIRWKGDPALIDVVVAAACIAAAAVAAAVTLDRE
jgi:hypothetical protein